MKNAFRTESRARVERPFLDAARTIKITFRRILNLLLYLSFCAMVGTGLLMAYRLIPGSRGGQGLEVLGWSRHEWGTFHTFVSYVFIALVAAHLVINWTWLIKVAANGHGWRLGAGLLVGAATVGAFLLLPISQREDRKGKNQGTSLSPSPGSDFIRVSSVSNEGPGFYRDIYGAVKVKRNASDHVLPDDVAPLKSRVDAGAP